MRSHRSSSRRCTTFRRLAGFGALVVLAHAAPAAAAPARQCKGGKALFAGECLYPDEIEKRKQARAEQRRAAAEQQQQDAALCSAARQADTVAAWRDYLQRQPEGSCRQEAAHRIQRLEEEAAAIPSEPDPEAAPGAAPAPPPPTSTPPPPAPPPPPPAPPAPPANQPPTSASSEDAGISPWVWIGFGVGAAGFITFGVTGAMATAQASELKEDCPGDVCPPDRDSDIDDARLVAHVATAGLIVGAVGASVGIVALVLSLGDDHTADTARPARPVHPYLGPGSVGVVGTF